MCPGSTHFATSPFGAEQSKARAREWRHHLSKSGTVVEARFELDDEDEKAVTEIDERFAGCTYSFNRRLDNTFSHCLDGGPTAPMLGHIWRDLLRLAGHADAQASVVSEDGTPARPHTTELNAIVAGWRDSASVSCENAGRLRQWLDGVTPLIDETSETEVARLDTLSAATAVADLRARALSVLYARLPVFVYFSNYFRGSPAPPPRTPGGPHRGKHP